MEIQLVNDDGLAIESLKLDENDPIFAMSFRQMITDHFAEGKHFFVAKILSKNINWAAAATTSITQGTNSNAQIAPSFEHAPPNQSEVDKDNPTPSTSS